ncbi:MAG: DUF362 domain-containing protein [Verrucomicrobiota bacterium]
MTNLYLRTALLVLLGTGGAGAQQEAQPVLPPKPVGGQKSRVVLIERPQAVQAFTVDGNAVRTMFSEALKTLTQQSSVPAAWKALGITPQDVVGIKITTEGGPRFSTKRALVGTIVAGLREAGVPASNIIIWDKQRVTMERAQWPVHAGGTNSPATMAVLPDTRWNGQTFVNLETVGKLIYGDHLFKGKATGRNPLDAVQRVMPDDEFREDLEPPDDQLSNKSFYADILARRCTKIINVPVLSDSALTGLYATMASLAVGSVDNHRRFTGRPHFGDPAIAEILDQEVMRSKVVLHVLDALIAQYAGGPQFNPQFTKSIGALYLSTDPVAIDSLLVDMLNRWRRASQVDPMPPSNYIQTADKYGIGNAHPNNIELIRVE